MEKGLTEGEVLDKQKQFGRNEIIVKSTTSPLLIFLSQFPTFINGILVVAGIFSFVIKEYIDSFFILTVPLVNGVFGFFQEYKAEKALEKLNDYVKPASRVLRDGKEKEVPTSSLVPGDVVILGEGDRIPADGLLFHHEELEVDESILTGESLPILKKQNDILFSGTLVTKGKGKLQVQTIGMATKFGEIAQSLSQIKPDKTPLEKRLTTLGKIVSLVAIIVALLIIPAGIVQQKEISFLIILAISIGIAAIPEGLPAIVTIALAIGTNRMAKKRAIVRKMPAVETLGSVQVILVDKTGTLTQNIMRVKKHWIQKTQHLQLFLQACVLGNTASLVPQGTNGDLDVIGDKTDGALLLFAHSQVKNLEELKTDGKIIDEFVFDPIRRMITTVFMKQRKKYVFVRGAPESIIANCKLTIQEKEKLISHYEEFAKEGLRVIGFAHKIGKQEHTLRTQLEENLEFLGFVGIYDPPRPEVKQAVEKARNAGIQTIMVTGDNELTAKAIAREIGLIEKDEDVITGEELDKLSDENLLKLLPTVRIYARSKPEQKLRLVELFKKQGFVVGVTGDGVNDSLALKRADVGVAMGKTGTEVAKEASDIVLTDDNFATLVNAVEEGRRIYDNILKSTTYLLSGNLSELSLVFLGAVSGLPTPLLPTQILWMNIATDVLPALALAADHKDPDLLKRTPRDPKSPILSLKRVLFIAIVGFGISQILLLVFSWLLQNNSETFARTIVFNLLILSHMVLAFIVRGGSMFRPNKFLIMAVAGTIIIQALITTLPFFQTIFHLGIE